MAHVLLPEWMGGKRQGHEWVGERKSNGGIGDSWSVNLNTGAWGAFATGQAGGDLVSLYAALNHLNQGAALEQVAERVGVTDRNVPVLPRSAPKEDYHPEPIPLSTPDIPGQPTAVYRYGTAFAVARRDTPSGKSFKQWTWFDGHWRGKAHPDPKPIYNLSGLAKSPDAPVLIVEGEKCADAAAKALRSYVVVTWAGGSNAVSKNDWTPLTGRKVLIWPDADEAGGHAGAELVTRLLPIAAEVRILNPDDHADGWDAADAIAEGWDAGRIAAWAKDRVRTVDAVPTAPKKSKVNGAHMPTAAVIDTDYLPSAEKTDDYESGSPPRSSLVVWQQLGLAIDTKQVPHPTLSNVSLILQRCDYYRGKVWLDSFRGKVYHALDGAPKLWTDADSRRATAWIQQQLTLPKITLALVQEGVMHAAECHARNSLTDWLDSLQWDGVPRLETWLADCLGAERNPYNDAVARNWPLSMVARAYLPGCQVDTMPVLEGKMGRGKSKFLDVLASPWYASIQIAFGEKDFFQAIQGRWLIEVPDMSGFSRREHSQILATITTRVDVYRKSHGRITEEHPRVTVFAATSENDEYLQESRGRRRYWPLRCGHIEIDTLHAQRDLVFAEAVARYRAGANWYQMPDETDEEQSMRASRDVWTDRVMNYVEAYGDGKLTSANILERAVEMKPDRLDEHSKRRIYRILMENGWKQLHGRERYWKKVTSETKES